MILINQHKHQFILQTSSYQNIELEEIVHEALQSISAIVSVEIHDISPDEDSRNLQISGDIVVNDSVKQIDLQDYINLELPGSLNLLFLSPPEIIIGEDNFRLRKILSFL